MLRSEKVKHLQITDPHPHTGLSAGNRGLKERRGLLEVTEGVGLGLGRGGPAPRCPESVGPSGLRDSATSSPNAVQSAVAEIGPPIRRR